MLVQKEGMIIIPSILVEKLDFITIPYESTTFPLIMDKLFIEKLSQFKDFNIQKVIPKPTRQREVEEIAKRMCAPDNIELSTYQTTIRNFLSNDTPYNGLLLFHGLGTGKTCSAITVAEEHRKFLKQSGLFIQHGSKRREKRIYVLGGPNIKSNFKKQLFDPSKLEYKDGEWTCKKSCLGNALLREVNPTNLNLTKDELTQRIQDTLRHHYKFMGYIEFANMVMQLKKHAIKQEFEHSMIIIDEVHNIKGNEVEAKFTASDAIDLITKNTTVKLLFLSATPMFNEPSEIVWITNMLNQNDKRPVIIEKDFFKEGALIESQTDDFLHHIRGYVSFVKGENPYSFPYRVYPDMFDDRTLSLPTLDIDNNPVKPLKTKVYPVQLSKYQAVQYLAKLSTINLKDVKNFTANISLLSALNMSYPGQVNELTTYMKSRNAKYEYYPKRTHCFDPEHIGEYSAKIDAICNHVKHSTGIVLIYSRMISEGVIPVALAIESMGYENVNGNLLSSNSSSSKYCLITGESNHASTAANIKLINSDENINGDKIKVVIITEAASEGVDFSNIRQIHIMDPWWHLNRNEQIIGRGIRLCSHKNLPFEQRNAQIFLYVSFIGQQEAFEYYLYRYAEDKASKIGKVARLLKENAMDCVMNHTQFRPIEAMNLVVKQTLSTGTRIDYPIGDDSYSVLCDFMDCTYKCNVKERPIIYPRKLFDLNRTMEQIRTLFKHGYVYTASDLFRELNLIVPMTYDQLYEALTQMIDLKMECKDMTRRSGYIVNYGNYYLFQPKQLPGPVPVNERRIPSNEIYHSIVVTPDVVIQETNIIELIDTMRTQYETATSSSREEDWYSMVNISKTHIVQTLQTKLKEPFQDKLFNQCIVDHMIEMLLYNQCLELINYLFFNQLDPFEEMLKAYFQVYDGVIRLWDNSKIVHLRIHENKWKETFMKNKDKPNTTFGTVVGGIVNKNELERFFKSKSMKILHDMEGITYSQICTQATKKSVQDRIKEVLGLEDYKSEVKPLCCELEMLLRYLQKIRYLKKTWFLYAVEVLENTEHITRENNSYVVNLLKNVKDKTKK